MAKLLIVENIGKLATLNGAVSKGGRWPGIEDLGLIENALLVCLDGKILWTGKKSDLPKEFKKKPCNRVDARGGTVIPGFVDSHTHLVFAGDRTLDFEKRLEGVSYQAIAQAGGGILTTMTATRKASEKELYALAMERIKNAQEQGITTIEIKTGYGLDFKSEKKLLNVISLLKKKSKIKILSTFMAAHAVPPEYKGRKSEYVREVCEVWIPKLKSQIDFLDLFLDQGYFDKTDAENLMTAAQKFNIPVKIHADEIALTGGSEVAVKCGALSADHLLQITSKEIKLLAESECTATLLPTTALFLNERFAPARELISAGARVALASDFNPGTSPAQDMSVTGLLAALKLEMSPAEILVGLTLNGAYALGLQKQKGALMPGFDGDFIILPDQSITSFFYAFGQKKLSRAVFACGRCVKKS